MRRFIEKAVVAGCQCVVHHNLHACLREPTELVEGDSVYIDSTMRHAYLSAGEGDAQILVMCSSATPNLAQTLREILKERLAKGDLVETETLPAGELKHRKVRQSARARNG